MRLTAPLIGGAAIALAVALVWFFQPSSEPRVPREPESTARSEAPAASSLPPEVRTPAANPAPAPASREELTANAAPEPERSPLPGEAPATPMAQIMAERQQNMIIQNNQGNAGVPPQLVDGERAFAAEPIDGTWAPGAEAKLLSTFAQMPGLELIDLQVQCRSTMCRVQLTQPPAAGGGQLPFNILSDEVGMKPRWMMAVVDGPPGPPGPPQPGVAPRPMKSIAYLWREGLAPEPATRAADDPN
jgi:hypothetical protein